MYNINDIKNISILSVARELGYTIDKVGNYYTLKEHDSVRISDKKNLFTRNSNGVKGSVIDFVMEFNNMTFHDAINYLGQENKIIPDVKREKTKKQTKEKPVLTLPTPNYNNHKAIAYLNKRGISQNIIEEFIDNKLLYQDERNNCVFVSYKDNKPQFACFRGTAEKRFLGDVPGSSYDYCFFIDNQSDTLVISESVIDAMSIMTLKQMYQDDYKKYNYLALSGVDKYEKSLNYHLNQHKYKTICIQVDNDLAGENAVENITNYINSKFNKCEVKVKKPLYGKDFNDTLQHIINHKAQKNQIKEKENNIMSNKNILSGLLTSEPVIKDVELKNGDTVKRAIAYMNIMHGEGQPATSVKIEAWNENAENLSTMHQGERLTMVSHMKEVKYKDGNKETLHVLDKIDKTNTIQYQINKLLTLYCKDEISQVFEYNDFEKENNVEKQQSQNLNITKDNNLQSELTSGNSKEENILERE